MTIDSEEKSPGGEDKKKDIMGAMNLAMYVIKIK